MVFLFFCLVFGFFFVVPFLFFFLVDAVRREFRRGSKGLSRAGFSQGRVLSLREKVSFWQSWAFKRFSGKFLMVGLFLGLPLANAVLSVFVYGVLLGLLLDVFLCFGFFVFLRFWTRAGYEAELKLLDNLLIFKRSVMGLVDKDADKYNFAGEFTVVDWDESNTRPVKLCFTVPVTFSSDKRTTFRESLSEKFGFGGVWVVDPDDGWDENGNGSVTFVWEEFLSPAQRVFVKMFLSFKHLEMGLVDNSSGLFTYGNEFEVLDWDAEGKPERLRLFLPVSFDPLRKEAFLDRMSIKFGRGRPWEIDEEDREFPGWNTDLSVATLVLRPPLPSLALWSEDYVLNDRVQWSFFPLGIGSKGGVPFVDPESGKEFNVVGFDVNGAQGKFMKKQGWHVSGDLLPAPHVIGAGVTGGGKSVCQRNIILSCLTRPERWFLVIIDLKRVEGALWRRYGVPVATTYEDAACLLSYAQKVMMDRFEFMEKSGVNNWADVPKEKQGTAILVMVDEAGELLGKISGSSDIDKENIEFQGQCLTAMESIARLGRAAQVHMVTFAQRPDSDTISMQIRQNSPVKLGAGALPSTISRMLFESEFGATVPASPQGRMGIQIHSVPPSKFQGFFADESWLDEYLERRGLPVNILGSNEMVKIYEDNKRELEDELEREMSDDEYAELIRSMG